MEMKFMITLIYDCLLILKDYFVSLLKKMLFLVLSLFLKLLVRLDERNQKNKKSQVKLEKFQ